MTPLRVGIFDTSFRGYDPSITHHQIPPPSLEYVNFPSGSDLDACDVVIATTDFARTAPLHRRRVLWLPENREFQEHPPRHVMAEFDLVLTNDMALVSAMPGRARWLTLIGTWIAPRADAPEKTRGVSMIASAKSRTSGHRLRHQIGALGAIPPGDCFGELFGRGIPTKDEALWSYRFSVVVEPARYDCFVTEKLCDAFATRTVPLYWGPLDLSPLASLGFETGGVIPFDSAEELHRTLADLVVTGRDIYDDWHDWIEHNQCVARELYCTEVVLERVLREHFSL